MLVSYSDHACINQPLGAKSRIPRMKGFYHIHTFSYDAHNFEMEGSIKKTVESA